MDRRAFIKKMSAAGLGGLAAASVLYCTSQPGKRPNIIVILADDMGYSDIGPFGGEIPTPNLSYLAENGYRMTQFYNAARCCPTRASLLTGLYPHQAGIGDMTGAKKDKEGNVLSAYQGYLNQQCMTMGEVMKANGYQTAISGKWHVGETREHWPARRGFDKSFAFINGACDFFQMKKYWSHDQVQYLTLNDEVIKPHKDFYMTSEISTYASRFIQECSTDDNPFFMYVAYTAPHWPLHALPEDIEKFRGKYMDGWDALREERYERMLQMGLIDSEWPLSPTFKHPEPEKEWRNDEKDILTPDWNSLSDSEKEKWDLRMAVYAAMIYRMDLGIGEMIQTLEKEGQLDNTLIFFMSDNGACHEAIWTWNLVHDESGEIGSPESFDSYGFPWANASNTPYRLFKHWTTEGGIATPLIAYWPAEIRKNILDTENVGHIVDVMATCVDVSGSNYPAIFNNNEILPMEGTSLLPAWKGKKLSERPIFWEHEGNWAVRKGKWKLVSPKKIGKGGEGPALYDLIADRVEMNDLAEKYPDKVKELIALWKAWADKVGVICFM